MGVIFVVLFFVGLFLWIIANANKKAMHQSASGAPAVSASPVGGKLSPERLAELVGRKIAKSLSHEMFRQLFGGVKMAGGLDD